MVQVVSQFAPFSQFSTSSISSALVPDVPELTDSDDDNICAVNQAFYDGGAHCGQWITIRNTQTGAQTAVSSPAFDISRAFD